MEHGASWYTLSPSASPQLPKWKQTKKGMMLVTMFSFFYLFHFPSLWRKGYNPLWHWIWSHWILVATMLRYLNFWTDLLKSSHRFSSPTATWKILLWIVPNLKDHVADKEKFRFEVWMMVGNRPWKGKAQQTDLSHPTCPSLKSFLCCYLGTFFKVGITQPDNVGKTNPELSNLEHTKPWHHIKTTHRTFHILPKMVIDIQAKERNSHASYM